jgi:hypothetical protein
MLIRRKREYIRVASRIQFCGGHPSAPEKEISDAQRREMGGCGLGLAAQGLGGRHYMDQGGDRVGGFEVKLYGPEGVLFDIAEHPWTGTEPLPVERAEAVE